MNRRRDLLRALPLLALGRPAAAEEAVWRLLAAGGCAVLMRHEQTEAGIGDPSGFRLDDCSNSVLGFAMTFFAIWWAWMNFTWFASAYDTDVIPYRLAVFVQMSGALVLAAGIPRAMEHGDFTVGTIGYVVMRLYRKAKEKLPLYWYLHYLWVWGIWTPKGKTVLFPKGYISRYGE